MPASAIPDRDDAGRHDGDGAGDHPPIHGRSLILMNPSMMICPAMVAVTVELMPQHRSAMPNSVGAIARPSNGASSGRRFAEFSHVQPSRRGRRRPPGSGSREELINSAKQSATVESIVGARVSASRFFPAQP